MHQPNVWTVFIVDNPLDVRFCTLLSVRGTIHMHPAVLMVVLVMKEEEEVKEEREEEDEEEEEREEKEEGEEN